MSRIAYLTAECSLRARARARATRCILNQLMNWEMHREDQSSVMMFRKILDKKNETSFASPPNGHF